MTIAMKFTFLLTVLINTVILVLVGGMGNYILEVAAVPTVNDPNLRVEVYAEGINLPSNIAFLAPDDLLVLEKDTGDVKRVVNGTMLEEHLLNVDVSAERWSMEQGLLGIAVSKDNADNQTGSKHHTFVFLYFTEFQSDEGVKTDDEGEEEASVYNRLYRYELAGNKLVNPKLLFEVHGSPATGHNGGMITIGPDNNIYFVVGDIEGYRSDNTKTKAQNFVDGLDPDGRAGILRLTQNGQPVGNGILGDNHPLNLYYAYGIRNSFGMDFDPLTGNLWDTENGPSYGDEINLVEPGFNSGWQIIQGVNRVDPNNVRLPSGKGLDPEDLVNFGGTGKYSDPEFVWNISVGPSAIRFLDSTSLGKDYENDLFVSDVNLKNIYRFELDESRTGLRLGSQLEDKIANDPGELQDMIFAAGFGRITDVEVGPDGYLYVVSYRQEKDPFDSKGNIYRIVPITKS
jgi:aldose sugar dehydrogenase